MGIAQPKNAKIFVRRVHRNRFEAKRPLGVACLSAAFLVRPATGSLPRSPRAQETFPLRLDASAPRFVPDPGNSPCPRLSSCGSAPEVGPVADLSDVYS